MVRARPFSVILFDEIEKAHPRILDKFLQILEDGRLTDGRGATVYFSEAILIFTSNLGISISDDHGQRQLNIQPGEPYEQVERKVRTAIADYFKFTLGRPEILNRIGDNIVVFDFIQPAIAEQIFTGMLDHVARRMADEHDLTLLIPEPVRQQLLVWCTEELSDGGRGIGNRLETTFVNPLARALFHRAVLRQQLEQEQQVAARHYTQQVIGETLAELGYEVETGFATLFVEGGMAHIQQPDWGDYYVRLRVKPDAGDLNLNVVRVSADRAAPSNEQARRDREMEEQWCAAHRELLHRLEQRGIAGQALRAHAPGELPVQCVQPDTVQHARRGQIRRAGGSLRQRVL